MNNYDAVIVGAGAAGLMCAIQAGKRGRKVVLLERGDKPGAKILISGGGRCNFTNLGTGPENFISQNPHFCKSALSRFTPSDFVQMVQDHRIPHHEKKLGQLFCDQSAQEIVAMLTVDCEKAGVEIALNCKVEKLRQKDGFSLRTSLGDFLGSSLVIASGGLSIPKVGATDFGYRVAKQFGLSLVETAPALDGFCFKREDLTALGGLMGISADVTLTCHGHSFRENILFTHVGLSGPAALQASLYWREGDPIEVNFLPQFEEDAVLDWFQKKKRAGKEEAKSALRDLLPKRLADRLCDVLGAPAIPLPRWPDKALRDFCSRLRSYSFIPASTVGYQKAEVTRGGVDTDELSSKTMESKKVPGLYFIGEVVDVTGWLGGYNFQWAWASGFAAGQAV